MFLHALYLVFISSLDSFISYLLLPVCKTTTVDTYE